MKRTQSTTLLALAFGATGCVYYNGIYNSKADARKGDAAFRSGQEDRSRQLYVASADRADSVLARFPKSGWRTRALFLSGHGQIMGGDCEKGLPRIREFMTRSDASVNDRDDAKVALAVCDVLQRRNAQARATLDSLITSKSRTTAHQARIWAARAALDLGDVDGASRYLTAANARSFQWEMVIAAQKSFDWDRLESLLVQLGHQGDYRAEVPGALRDLWRAGHFDGVDRIVRAYDDARVRDQARAQMHFAVGEMSMNIGRDSSARVHFFIARRLAANDTITERESAARLGLLDLARTQSLRDVDTVIARIDTATRRSQYYRKVADQLLLFRMLQSAEDSTGATLFLAAEVARDSLRAPKLALNTFRQVAANPSFSLFAPRALAAAAMLSPDSASAFSSRILTMHPRSSIAAWIRGEDPSAPGDAQRADDALETAWSGIERRYADTLRKLREAETRANPPVTPPVSN